MEKLQILKTLVGSRAHKLETPESDHDYRGVYLGLTRDLVGVSPAKVKGTHWVEGGNEDDTAYELGHFLHLATKSNPTILETFIAPTIQMNSLGWELRDLFSKVWNTESVVSAFVGYSLNQRKKFLDRNEKRKNKFAVAYLRTLSQAYELITTGNLSIEVPVADRPHLRDIKKGLYSRGEVVEESELITDAIYAVWSDIKGTDKEHFTDMEAIDKFLIDVRYKNFHSFEPYWNMEI